MKNKIIALLLMLVFVFATFAACGDRNSGNDNGGTNPPDNTQDGDDVLKDDVTYETYGSFWMRQHNYKTMPVATYNSCPPQLSDFTHNYFESEQTFIDYAEAGVNVMMGLYEYAGSAEAEQALDWCSDNGLAYLLPLGGAESFLNDSIPKSTLARVKYHDAFAGIMQMDEPGGKNFEKMKRSAEIIESVLPEDVTGALMYVNLFPTYATEKQLYFRVPTTTSVLPEGGYDYEQYLTDYVTKYQPKMLSYDFYACGGAVGNLESGYFDNMAIIRSYAMDENIPFWVFVQTCSFNKYMRIPTEADILWQVNTSLAYGAKGIQYFTGVLPTNGDGTGEIFTGAMFDRDGNKTAIYDYVKRANTQIGAIDGVLMCSTSKGVILAGAMPYNGAETEFPEEDVLTSYGDLSSVTAAHAMVGCFDYEESKAYYAVNNSVLENDSIKLSFGKSVSGYTVKGGVKTAFSGNELTLAADAGEGILIVLDK